LTGYTEGLKDPKQKLALFNQETQTVIKRTQEEIKEKMKRKSVYHRASNPGYVKPMMAVTWHTILVALSFGLDENDDAKVIHTLLDGLKGAIRVSSIFGMDTERDAFVTALAKFTCLDGLREMKPKNLEAIAALIEVAEADANSLKESWKEVLRNISHLERLYLMGSGGKIDDSMGSDKPGTSGNKNMPAGRRPIKTNFDDVNAPLIVSKAKPAVIDRIFTNSVKLNK